MWLTLNYKSMVLVSYIIIIKIILYSFFLNILFCLNILISEIISLFNYFFLSYIAHIQIKIIDYMTLSQNSIAINKVYARRIATIEKGRTVSVNLICVALARGMTFVKKYGLISCVKLYGYYKAKQSIKKHFFV